MGERPADIVQQRSHKDGVSPPIPLLPDRLCHRAAGKNLATSGVERETSHLQGMGEQAAGSGVMVGFGCRQQLHEFGVGRDNPPHVALEVLGG